MEKGRGRLVSRSRAKHLPACTESPNHEFPKPLDKIEIMFYNDMPYIDGHTKTPSTLHLKNLQQ